MDTAGYYKGYKYPSGQHWTAILKSLIPKNEVITWRNAIKKYWIPYKKSHAVQKKKTGKKILNDKELYEAINTKKVTHYIDTKLKTMKDYKQAYDEVMKTLNGTDSDAMKTDLKTFIKTLRYKYMEKFGEIVGDVPVTKPKIDDEARKFYDSLFETNKRGEKSLKHFFLIPLVKNYGKAENFAKHIVDEKLRKAIIDVMDNLKQSLYVDEDLRIDEAKDLAKFYEKYDNLEEKIKKLKPIMKEIDKDDKQYIKYYNELTNDWNEIVQMPELHKFLVNTRLSRNIPFGVKNFIKRNKDLKKLEIAKKSPEFAKQAKAAKREVDAAKRKNKRIEMDEYTNELAPTFYTDEDEIRRNMVFGKGKK